jgi:hypothetical protein
MGKGKADEAKKPKPKKRRWLKRLGIASGASVVLGLGLWYGVNHTSWMGPLLADGLRKVFGARFVAWLEDTAYSAQDRLNQWRYKDAKPKTFWEPPSIPPPRPEPPTDKPNEKVFFPEAFAPPFPEIAATGDGVWAPMPDADDAKAPAIMYRAITHPDPRRGYAALALVAIEREAVDIHLVAGTSEPESPRVQPKDRPGKIPESHHAGLIAAFNGGFKATHGEYGLLLDGMEFLPPKDYSCTFVHYTDGKLAIATWSKLKSAGIAQLSYYRQTPPCLVEDGELPKVVEVSGEYAKGWGATVSGETVIRRSAIGLSKDGKIVYYGIGDALTAQSLARGMKAAGGYWVAELDVNYSFPRFLLYSRGEGGIPFANSSIIPAVDFAKNQYIVPSPRDFFYLTRSKRKKAALAPHASDSHPG